MAERGHGHDGTGRAEIAERERQATANADAHYTFLHRCAGHEGAYHTCDACQEKGWR